MTSDNKRNRREFLARSTALFTAAVGFPTIVSSRVLGRGAGVAPSNQVTLACIGVGWQGTSNMEGFLEDPEVRILAVCDIDKEHLENARGIVNKAYRNEDCLTFHNFEDVVSRPGIDAISLGLPDHWHAIPAVAAAAAGKDIYGEKPLAHNWAEGRAICDAVKRYGRVWQTGSWQRSIDNFRFGCELVLNGRIGKVHTIEVGLPEGHTDFAGTKGLEEPAPPPPTLDYERWLGPAPYAPYCVARVHKNWRWNLDYAGGQIMDWVGHHVDIAHWGAGLDYEGPVQVDGEGTYPDRGRLWNTATRYRVNATYAKGIKMIIAGGHSDIRSGTKWIGDQGWVWVNRGAIDAQPKSLLKDRIAPGEIHLFRSPGHTREFIQCVKSRGLTLSPAEVAHRSATPGMLGQIAMLTGREIRWDPVNERILGDPQAERLLFRPMRSPWHL